MRTLECQIEAKMVQKTSAIAETDKIIFPAYNVLPIWKMELDIAFGAQSQIRGCLHKHDFVSTLA
jgi:hypothetical protein